MYRLEKTFRFEASHRLPFHPGKCARLHGHSWRFTVCLEAPLLQETGPAAGMVVDFNHIRDVVAPIIDEYLDHRHLNESLDMENPTSENVAKWLFFRLRSLLTQEGRTLVTVRVHETCTSTAEFSAR